MLAAIAPGTPAPEIALPSTSEELWSLSAQRGRWVVVYFYPKDFTPGCTTEAADFATHHQAFVARQVAVVGISRDSTARHLRFAAKLQLPFPLLSDAQGDTCQRYGVWQEKKMYGKVLWGIVRTTVIIDPQGTVSWIFSPVKVSDHAAAVLTALDELNPSGQ